jgi:hypothetical protein
MGHRGEQDLAAEAAVERVHVELADRCLGDGIGPRVPPRRVDQLGQEQLVQVRVSFPVDLVQRPLEHGKGLCDPVGEPQGAAQLERYLAAPRRVGEQLETGVQVVDRGRAICAPLRRAELDQHLRPGSRIHLLLQRAGQIPDCGIGRTLGKRTLGRPAQRRHHKRVSLRGHPKQVPRRALRQGAGFKQQFSSKPVRGGSLHHIRRLVDGAADDGVKELERSGSIRVVGPDSSSARRSGDTDASSGSNS